MIAFLDTEFTDLIERPRLLSIAIVLAAPSGREFYAEITDREHLDAASQFVQQKVLPQFGKVADAACTHEQLGGRLSRFFGELKDTLGPDEFIDLAFDCQLDWELLLRAIEVSRPPEWKWTRHFIRPANVFNIDDAAPGKAAAAAYFREQEFAPFSRHHALCDARALSIAHQPSLARRPGQARVHGGEARVPRLGDMLWRGSDLPAA